MQEIRNVVNYQACPKMFDCETSGMIRQEMPNELLKSNMSKAITALVKENLSLEEFEKCVGSTTVSHGTSRVTEVSVKEIYEVVQSNLDKIDLDNQIVKIEFRTPDDYSKSLYYNLIQVMVKDNKPLQFCAIVLNKKPLLQIVDMPAKTSEEVAFLKNVYDTTAETILTTASAFYPRPNNISCNVCAYNYLCKPVGFTREG